MIRRLWRRLAPWATPTLVMLEVCVVWFGLIPLGTAVLVGVLIELALWITAASRTVAAVRRFRAGRASGIDPWRCAEDGLAQLVPRRAARIILIEPRLWNCLWQWVTGNHHGRRGDNPAYRYDSQLRGLLWAVTALVVIEGAVAEMLIAAFAPSTVWIYLSLAVHAYAVFGLLGIMASFATRPHLLEQDRLMVRDGIFTELILPYRSIETVRRVRRSNFGRSGLKLDQAGAALLAHGDANVEITLQPDQPLQIGRPEPIATTPIRTLSITVNDARQFTQTLNRHCAEMTYRTPGQ